MTAYTNVVTSRHKVLVAGTVDTVTFPGDGDSVEVLNRDGAAEIYFRVDGVAPTVGGDDTYAVPAGVGATPVPVSGSGPTVVKLISAGTPAYSVTLY